jgi:hypothetical protein
MENALNIAKKVIFKEIIKFIFLKKSAEVPFIL